jgi:hypothetical protein
MSEGLVWLMGCTRRESKSVNVLSYLKDAISRSRHDRHCNAGV